jgi:hypothetical protein
MAEKLLFLSHIHEERNLALLIQDALDAEFSGFVRVFVSSDGKSISAGSNFLKRIEDELASCIGAIYLISPASVKRNWINFELGAVWIRNVLNVREGKPEIPTLPVCHSGLTPGELPSPLNNLNGVAANEASELEFAFRSLQTAVGGRGVLRTDFRSLAEKIITLEKEYTLGSNLKKMFSLLSGDIRRMVDFCQQAPAGQTINFKDRVEAVNITLLKEFEAKELKGHVQIKVGDSFMTPNRFGAPVMLVEVLINMSPALVMEFKELLLN